MFQGKIVLTQKDDDMSDKYRLGRVRLCLYFDMRPPKMGLDKSAVSTSPWVSAGKAVAGFTARRHQAADSVIFQIRDTSESRQLSGSPLIQGKDGCAGHFGTCEAPLLPKHIPLTFLIPVPKMAKITFPWLVHYISEATTAILLLQRANLVHYLIFIFI